MCGIRLLGKRYTQRVEECALRQPECGSATSSPLVHNPEPLTTEENAHRISLTAPPSLLRLTEVLENLVRLISTPLFRACMIFCLLCRKLPLIWPRMYCSTWKLGLDRFGKTLVDHEISLVCPARRPTQSRLAPKKPEGPRPWASVDCFAQNSPGRGRDWPRPDC